MEGGMKGQGNGVYRKFLGGIPVQSQGPYQPFKPHTYVGTTRPEIEKDSILGDSFCNLDGLDDLEKRAEEEEKNTKKEKKKKSVKDEGKKHAAYKDRRVSKERESTTQEEGENTVSSSLGVSTLDALKDVDLCVSLSPTTVTRHHDVSPEVQSIVSDIPLQYSSNKVDLDARHNQQREEFSGGREVRRSRRLMHKAKEIEACTSKARNLYGDTSTKSDGCRKSNENTCLLNDIIDELGKCGSGMLMRKATQSYKSDVPTVTGDSAAHVNENVEPFKATCGLDFSSSISNGQIVKEHSCKHVEAGDSCKSRRFTGAEGMEDVQKSDVRSKRKFEDAEEDTLRKQKQPNNLGSYLNESSLKVSRKSHTKEREVLKCHNKENLSHDPDLGTSSVPCRKQPFQEQQNNPIKQETNSNLRGRTLGVSAPPLQIFPEGKNMRPETKQVMHSKRPIANSDLMANASSFSGPQLLIPSKGSNKNAGESKSLPVIENTCKMAINLAVKKNISCPNTDSEAVNDGIRKLETKIPNSVGLLQSAPSATNSASVCGVESPYNVSRSSQTTTKSPHTRRDSNSFLSTQEKMELSSWGLPDAVLEKYHESGIHTMFPWQVECLSQPGVVEGKNLVYSAPTSAGKTLVAEMLLLKRVVEEGKKGLFILPFVSVSREKMYYLQKMFGSAGVRVDGFMGTQSPPGGLKNTDIAVCTIEKANNLINRLLEETTNNNNNSSSNKKKKRGDGGGLGLVGGVGVVVVDELHLVGDQHRGYLLELLLTKLTFLTRSQHFSQGSHEGVQIIGMSATLPNLPVLASWLGDAALYTTTHRPVPLQECLKLGTSIYDSQGSCIRQLSPDLTVESDSEHVTQLCLETVLDGYSVLIFCPTKSWCESLSATIARHFFNIGRTDSKYSGEVGERLRGTLDSEGISRVLDALRRCPVGLDSTLARTVAFGTAYHHAGLTLDERDIIEGGFRAGSVRILVATSTLCSGVNLPARRVIIRSLSAGGGGQLDPMTYKQMVGRAGRKGVDTEGESIIVCSSESEAKRARILLASHTLPPITSCLHTHNTLSASMKRAILEVIVSGLATSPQEVDCYCNCTLLAASLTTEKNEDANVDGEDRNDDSKDNDCSEHPSTMDSVTACLNFLLENEFIRKQNISSGGTKYIGTQLGLAVVGSGLSPDEGLRVFSELHRARQCFVLENELHILYQVTPTYICSGWAKLDWAGFLEAWEMLGEGGRRVGQLVGVDESFIVRAMKGAVNIKARQQAEQLAVHQRFYTALALQELVQEVSVGEVAARFGAARGALQALQQAAATFAGMVTVLCSRLGWDNLALLLGQFLPRLHHGARSDLCDLLRLPPPVDAPTARHLHSAGLTTVAAVATAGANVVEDVLHTATPFHSTKMESSNRMKRQGGRPVLLVSGRPLTEAQAARLIVAEARQLLQKDLGISNIAWSCNPTENISAVATAPLDSNTANPSLPGTTGSLLGTVKNSAVHSTLTLAAGRGIKRLSPLANTILRRKSKSPRYNLVPKEKGQSDDLKNLSPKPSDCKVKNKNGEQHSNSECKVDSRSDSSNCSNLSELETDTRPSDYEMDIDSSEPPAYNLKEKEETDHIQKQCKTFTSKLPPRHEIMCDLDANNCNKQYSGGCGRCESPKLSNRTKYSSISGGHLGESRDSVREQDSYGLEMHVKCLQSNSAKSVENEGEEGTVKASPITKEETRPGHGNADIHSANDSEKPITHVAIASSKDGKEIQVSNKTVMSSRHQYKKAKEEQSGYSLLDPGPHMAGNKEETTQENLHQQDSEEKNIHDMKHIGKKLGYQGNQSDESINNHHLHTDVLVETDNVRESDQSRNTTNNIESVKTCKPTRRKVGLAASKLFLRSRVKKTQDATLDNKEDESLVFIPESQENKSDNVFSPKGRRARNVKGHSGKEAERSKPSSEEYVRSVDGPGIQTNKKRSNKELFKLASNTQSRNVAHTKLRVSGDESEAEVNTESPMKVPCVSNKQIQLPEIIVKQVDEARKVTSSHMNDGHLDGMKGKPFNSLEFMTGKSSFTSSTPIIDTRIKAIALTNTIPHQQSSDAKTGQAFEDVTAWSSNNKSKFETPLKHTEDNSDLFNESCDEKIDGRGEVGAEKVVGEEDSQSIRLQHRMSRCSSEFLTDSQRENFLMTGGLDHFHLEENNGLSNEDEACQLSGKNETSILSCSIISRQQNNTSNQMLPEEKERYHHTRRPAHELSPSFEDDAEPYPDDVYEILTQNEQQAELQNRFPVECKLPSNQESPSRIKKEVSSEKDNEYKPQQGPKYIDGKHNSDPDDDDEDEALYPACIEYFDFGSDFSSCEADSPMHDKGQKLLSTRRGTTESLGGSYLSSVPHVLPDLSVESESIVSLGSEGLNSNVCEREEDEEQNEQRVPVLKENEKGKSQKQKKDEDKKNYLKEDNEIEKDHTLSDSFLEHAFDSYLHVSACETPADISQSKPTDDKQGRKNCAESYFEKPICQDNCMKSPGTTKWSVTYKEINIRNKPPSIPEAVQAYSDMNNGHAGLSDRIKHQSSVLVLPLSSRESIPQSENDLGLQKTVARNVDHSDRSHDVCAVADEDDVRCKEKSATGNMNVSFMSPNNGTFSHIVVTPRTEALLEGRLDSVCNSRSTEKKVLDVEKAVIEHKAHSIQQGYDTLVNISPFLKECNWSMDTMERGRLSDDLFLSPMSSNQPQPDDIAKGGGRQDDEAVTKRKAEDSRNGKERKNKTDECKAGEKIEVDGIVMRTGAENNRNETGCTSQTEAEAEEKFKAEGRVPRSRAKDSRSEEESKSKIEECEAGKKMKVEEMSRIAAGIDEVVGERPKEKKYTQLPKDSPEILSPGDETGKKMNKTRRDKEKVRSSRTGKSENERVTTPAIRKGASEASSRLSDMLTPATRAYLVHDFHQTQEEAMKQSVGGSLVPVSEQSGFSEILSPDTRKYLVQDFHQTQEEGNSENIPAVVGSVTQGNKLSTSNRVQEIKNANIMSSCAGDMTNLCHRYIMEKSDETSDSTRTSLPNSSSLCIIDVAGDEEVFKSFLREVKQQPVFSLSLACQKTAVKNSKKNGIGWRISHHGRSSRRSQGIEDGDVAGVVVEGSDVLVVGVAVCWGQRDAYYLNLRTVQEEAMSVTMPTPPLAAGVSFKDRVEAVKRLIEDDHSEGVVLRMWDAKAAVHALAKTGLGCVSGHVEDPRVAVWLLNPDTKQSNLHNMVVNYDPRNLDMLAGVGGGQGTVGLGQDTGSSESRRVRAATECVAVFHLIEALRTTLSHHGLLRPYVEVEMPSVVSMAYMELSGMGFSSKECQAQKSLLQKRLAVLESEAFRLAGHPFPLSSPAQVSQVLYCHLHLPLPLPGPAHTIPTPTSRGGKGSSSRVCGPTNKEALEYLSPHHPLPAVILEWRKITAALTKVVCPIQQAKAHCRTLAMDRIHPTAHTFTATGRITLHSPSLQSVPRDFTIQVESGDEKKIKGHLRHFANTAILDQLAPTLGSGQSVAKTVSVRRSLIAGRGRVLMAADYCQLELRLLAHFSADSHLLRVLGTGGNEEQSEQDHPDVFTAIAAQLHHTHHMHVTPDQRQKAKQICYGILYGMGTRALGEELGVGEEDAEAFLKEFHALFPATHTYLQEAVEACRAANGLVGTLQGRHRYLPNIDSQDPYLRSQSERQAVNTKIQGSAADLVKLAGIRIEKELREAFPSAPRYITHPGATSRGQPLRGAFLVLHLHDELIFEVCNEDVVQVSQVVRRHMEKVWPPLRVPLPIKLQVGPSWGTLQPFIL